jgi:hypothetical protein
MKTINENNGLTIEQLEERFEMVVASKGSSDPCMDVSPCPCGDCG